MYYSPADDDEGGGDNYHRHHHYEDVKPRDLKMIPRTYPGTRFQDEMIEPTFNLRLIEAVRHSRCLFDNTDRQYRNTEYKNRVWSRLVSVLNFDGDPRMLSARWKQLRDKYGKEKRKQKYGPEKSSWQYFKHLHFLDPHMTDRAEVSPSRKEADGVQERITDPNFAKSLIQEVQSHPCLYDARDPKYRHGDCRNQAWNLIIEKLNYPGNVNSIYKQWKKHRDRYVREKRRLRNITGLDSMVPPEISTWEMYEDMSWIDHHLDEQQMSRCARSLKRQGPGGSNEVNPDDGVLSEYDAEFEPEDDLTLNSYMMIPEKRAPNSNVYLDGDSAFSASIVSDLRTLPEHTRMLAKNQIMELLESAAARHNLQHPTVYI
ncbi:hypothetical protein B9Z55_004400 [Caenorhabditis nigoni]|uniref:MADF domain-containing protein n=1 Tax=Caenorhabditis nigoni TaxID=1611254 RepID=A0A2G5UX36_9PELO|nr:hypothetical protein B9Z55_004400 [Caenorhabditis nigoni]